MYPNPYKMFLRSQHPLAALQLLHLQLQMYVNELQDMIVQSRANRQRSLSGELDADLYGPGNGCCDMLN